MIDFDPDAVRARYKAERDKRVRTDGEEQYIEVAGQFATTPRTTPTPIRASAAIRSARIWRSRSSAAAFPACWPAARLREAGLDDFRIIEAGGDFGGTWYWNRYPGAQCDIESYCYLPLLEELNYIPKEKYSYVSEIFEHSQRIGHAYKLYDRALFQTRVSGLAWDERIKRWRISTNRGDDIRARFVIMALGPPAAPSCPASPASRNSRATASTPTAGTMATPAATPTAA